MRRLLLLFLFLSCFGLQAKELTAGDAQVLRTDLQAMYDAFYQGDTSLLVNRIHPSLLRFVGGKERLQSAINSSHRQLMASGFRFLSLEIGKPSRLYPAGEEEVCFVPMTLVAQMSGKKIKGVGFMIAIRKVNADHWTYMDGAGFKDDPNELWILLPQLERGITLPVSQMESFD